MKFDQVLGARTEYSLIKSKDWMKFDQLAIF